MFESMARSLMRHLIWPDDHLPHRFYQIKTILSTLLHKHLVTLLEVNISALHLPWE